jgi:hypothetical protein
MAYTPAFIAGVFVAAGDVDGDGRADIITGADAGGGPHVLAFSGVDGHVLRSFFAYDPGFSGGVRVAAADLDLDGFAEIITAPGPGSGPSLRVWDGATGAAVGEFNADDSTVLSGVFVGVAPPQSRMVIDVPSPGATVPPMFVVAGWAALGGATADSGGADVVHVWAVPVLGGAPIFAGAGPVGMARPDVAALFGGVYSDSGYGLVAGPLPPGVYDLWVFAHDSRSFTFTSWRVVRVTVTP